MSQENQPEGTLAEFGETQFKNPINDQIVSALEQIDLGPNRKLYILSNTTSPIVRASGANVLYNHEDVNLRLAAWPDARLQGFANPEFSDIGLYKGGFDPMVPLSGMTVMIFDTDVNEPIASINVLLQSPESLKEQTYIVKEDGGSFVVKNTFDALGVNPDSYAIVPGWASIVPEQRAGKGHGSLRTAKDVIKIGSKIVSALNEQLQAIGINAVTITQQDGKLTEMCTGESIPDFSTLMENDVININETNVDGTPRWQAIKKLDGSPVNVFKEYFAIGDTDSRSTGGVAIKSGMKRIPDVASPVDNQLAPVYVGLNPGESAGRILSRIES